MWEVPSGATVRGEDEAYNNLYQLTYRLYTGGVYLAPDTELYTEPGVGLCPTLLQSKALLQIGKISAPYQDENQKHFNVEWYLL